MFINGVPRSLGNVHKWFARKIGYVLQLAVPYYEELTVRQNLFFAAHMRLPKSMSNAQKFERVEQILAEVFHSCYFQMISEPQRNDESSMFPISHSSFSVSRRHNILRV